MSRIEQIEMLITDDPHDSMLRFGRGPAARNGDPNLMRQLDDIAERLST